MATAINLTSGERVFDRDARILLYVLCANSIFGTGFKPISMRKTTTDFFVYRRYVAIEITHRTYNTNTTSSRPKVIEIFFQSNSTQIVYAVFDLITTEDTR